ncbi:hypothetical protein [Nitrosomonas sp.]|uniref:hypothetical protein n=1 Tax=Nitrosomonas sp. TaxID=42353 RepID=UPI0035B21E03
MRVYLSSTLNDLLVERQAVRNVSGECIVVESYTAGERSVGLVASSMWPAAIVYRDCRAALWK